jgi:hypothetical protein
MWGEWRKGLVALLAVLVVVLAAGPVSALTPETEPAVAVNPINPQILAAGVDLESCDAGAPNTCPFTPGVGVSGVQLSLNGGNSWIQPTYTGFSARGCLGPRRVCQPGRPIGTLPNFFENGMVSNGDPAVVFGPQPGPGGFSRADGRACTTPTSPPLTREPGVQRPGGHHRVAHRRHRGRGGRRQPGVVGPGHRHQAELRAVR